MNTTGKHGGNDSSLDKGLDDLGRAYRALDTDGPPDLLDQAILNSAHRAVAKKPRWLQFGWLHGLTTAAVFVLAFSLILNQRESVPESSAIELDNHPAAQQSEMYRELRAQQAAPVMQMKAEPERALRSVLGIEADVEPGQDDKLQAVVGESGAALELREVAEEQPTKLARAKSVDTGLAEIATATPAADEDSAQDTMDSPIEQALAEIIRLKNAGNEDWRQALVSFKQQYPDYPLPAELED